MLHCLKILAKSYVAETFHQIKEVSVDLLS